MKKLLLVLSLVLLFSCNGQFQNIKNLQLVFENAAVSGEKNEITITTGSAMGKWKWTGHGIVTTGFKNLVSGTEWAQEKITYPSDWDLKLFGGDKAKARLISLGAVVSDDNGFTSKHIEVSAEIEYPKANLKVRYVIWAYPGAPGFRTQLFVKGSGNFIADTSVNTNYSRIDFLPSAVSNNKRQTIGFYNNNDGRNSDSLEFVDNRIFDTGFSGIDTFALANILFIYNDKEGIGMVKESQKVVNRESVNTGVFMCNDNGVVSTGWGLSPFNIKKEIYRPCWAGWRLLWTGRDDEKQLAFKMFDRMRYPVDTINDIFLMTNVWGGGKGTESAKEENILKEIKSCADLGIDVVQIDAGWGQRGLSTNPWKPSADVYPEGWSNIMSEAKKYDVKMGIWNTASSVNKNPDLLIKLYDEGFKYFKVDIGRWNTYEMLDSLINNARNLLIHSNYSARINWDVTHKEVRVGYLFAREYGNLFLQNRRLRMAKDKDPERSIYIPRRILRDEWQLSEFLNLNEIMFNVQNTDLVNPKQSNASQYGNVYSFAITMMSSPLFFQETWRYKQEARQPLKNLITIYKKYRTEMCLGYVFPIGDKPDDSKWTGFQNFNPATGSGYLTIFREINNTEQEKAIQLKFLQGKSMHLENLITGEKEIVQADADGKAFFRIAKPASFLFYRYESR